MGPETVQRDCEEDIRKWTDEGLRKSQMFRLLERRYAPLKLGEYGRQKVKRGQ